jgi:hypothetical protein
VKILANGNAKGFSVLRTQVTPQKEFNPRAFVIFGPKIVGMRRSYDDRALESRFLTIEMEPAAFKTPRVLVAFTPKRQPTLLPLHHSYVALLSTGDVALAVQLAIGKHCKLEFHTTFPGQHPTSDLGTKLIAASSKSPSRVRTP